jgi:hypothetical protein
MRVLGFVALIAIALWWFGSWPFGSAYTYRVEVGYYDGGKEIWYAGPDQNSREDCVDAAIAYFNSVNNANTDRAFSWACRKMQGEDFLDRVR